MAEKIDLTIPPIPELSHSTGIAEVSRIKVELTVPADALLPTQMIGQPIVRMIGRFRETTAVNGTSISVSDAVQSVRARYLVTSRGVNIYDLVSGQIVKTLVQASTINAICFSPDSTLLVAGDIVYNVANWDVVFDGGFSVLGSATAYAAEFSPDGSLLALGGYNNLDTPKRLRILDTQTWDPATGDLSPGSTVRKIVFSNDGSLLAVGHDSSPYLTVYNTSDWSKVSGTPTLPGTIQSLSFSHNDGILAVSHYNEGEFSAYDTSDWSKISGTPTYSYTPLAIACSPKWNHIAIPYKTSSSINYIRLYDLDTWDVIGETENYGSNTPYSLRFSNDAFTLTVGFSTGCRVLDARYLTTFHSFDPGTYVYGIDISDYFYPDLKLRVAENFKGETKFVFLPDIFTGLAISHGGTSATAGYYDATKLSIFKKSPTQVYQLWDEIDQPDTNYEHQCLSWYPGGRFLVVGGKFPSSTGTTSRFDSNYQDISTDWWSGILTGGRALSLSWIDDGGLCIGHYYDTNGRPPVVMYRDPADGVFKRATGTGFPDLRYYTRAEISPDGAHVFVTANHDAGYDQSPYIWAYENNGDGTFSAVTVNRDSVSFYSSYGRQISWSPNSQYCCINNSIFKWDDISEEFSIIATLTYNVDTLVRAAWSPDSQYLATASATGAYIYIYKRTADSFSLVKTLTAPSGKYTAICWSKNGEMLFVGSSVALYAYDQDGDDFTLNIDSDFSSIDGIVVSIDTGPEPTIVEASRLELTESIIADQFAIIQKLLDAGRFAVTESLHGEISTEEPTEIIVSAGRFSLSLSLNVSGLSLSTACSRFILSEQVKADVPFWLEVLILVNDERVGNDLERLKFNNKLQTAAIRHADDMATNQFLDHIGSDGSTPPDRMADAGYIASYVGENIIEGDDSVSAFSAQQAVDWWMNSEPHRENILDGSFRATGVFDAIGINGRRYVCQVFGSSTGEVVIIDAGRFGLVDGFFPGLTWWTGDLRFHLYVKNITSFGDELFIIGGNNLGANVLNLIHSGIGIEKQVKLINDLAGVLRKFMQQENSISGDPVVVPNKYLHSLAALDDFQLRQKINLAVADESVTTHMQHPSQIYLDGNIVTSQIQSTQLAYNPNTGRYEIVLGSTDASLYESADPETSPGEVRVQVHIGGQVVGFTVNTRTGDTEAGFIITGTSDVVVSSAPKLSVTTAEVYLDGRPLSGRAREINISCDEGDVHNEITIAGNDPELFAAANPEILYGEPRIEARIGARIINFLLLSRDGEKTDFVITGLSVSAREDMPFTTEMNFQLDEPALASDIAASVTQYCPVEWVADDWLVPSGFSFSGTPLYGITQLAGEIGAVVRCRDDGSILIRKRRPVRPVHMASAVADVSHNRSSLIVLGHSEDLETGYNAVKVTGQTPDSSFVPQIQLEPIPEGDGSRSPNIREACYIRVYWAGNDPSIFQTYVTDGLITPIGGGAFYTDIEETTIDFINGIGNVSLPIFELVSCVWIGDSGGQPTFVKHSTELSIGTGKFRVGKVRYRTQFQRYRIDMHNVERLIAVLFLGSAPGISVTIRTSDNPVEGDIIDAPLLTSEYAAVARGTDWIDRQYRKSICDITVPYHDMAVDGNIAYIDDDHIGEPGNYHIISSMISIEGPKILNSLRVEKCLTSFNR